MTRWQVEGLQSHEFQGQSLKTKKLCTFYTRILDLDVKDVGVFTLFGVQGGHCRLDTGVNFDRFDIYPLPDGRLDLGLTAFR